MSVHIYDLEVLEKSCPAVNLEFMKGHFVTLPKTKMCSRDGWSLDLRLQQYCQNIRIDSARREHHRISIMNSVWPHSSSFARMWKALWGASKGKDILSQKTAGIGSECITEWGGWECDISRGKGARAMEVFCKQRTRTVLWRNCSKQYSPVL